MGRPRFEVLVLPYAPDAFAELAFAVVRDRTADAGWRAIGGGGARGEVPLDAARRHACAQAGVSLDRACVALDSRATLRIETVAGSYEIPAHAFAVCVDPADLAVAGRHELRWLSYEAARGLLACELERDALWELRRRIGRHAACR
jgi:hypothetical protein